jgi:hypothetical protein
MTTGFKIFIFVGLTMMLLIIATILNGLRENAKEQVGKANLVQAAVQARNNEIKELQAMPKPEVAKRLRSYLAARPLGETESHKMMLLLSAAQKNGFDKDQKIAKLMTAAERRDQWVKLRAKKDIEAVVVCKSAIKRTLKAPDEVQWKGRDVGYDPDEDWIFNVVQEANAMNSFGARLRTSFFCRVQCVPQEDSLGSNCYASKVWEQ